MLKPGGTFYMSDSVTNTSLWLRQARRLWHRIARRRSPSADIDEFLDEHEVQRSAAEFSRWLEEADLQQQDVVFFNHVGLRDVLPPRLRRIVIRALSRPGRRRSGDLIFIIAKRS